MLQRLEGVVRKTRRERATGSVEIPMDVLKYKYKAGMKWMTGLFNVSFRTSKMLEEWR